MGIVIEWASLISYQIINVVFHKLFKGFYSFFNLFFIHNLSVIPISCPSLMFIASPTMRVLDSLWYSYICPTSKFFNSITYLFYKIFQVTISFNWFTMSGTNPLKIVLIYFSYRFFYNLIIPISK